jgi:transposase
MKIEIPLDIPDITVLKVDYDPHKNYQIEIKSNLSSTHCRICGKEIKKFHGFDQPIYLRHLPILGKQVYLKICPKRYQCPFCSKNPTTTQRLAWYEGRKSYTKAYEEHVLKSLVNSTVEDVSIKEKVGYETIMGMFERYFPEKIDFASIKKIGTLGLDEIALRKGHKHFVVIITCKNEDGLRILGVLKNRKKETIVNFFQKIPSNLKESIHTVCSDMYEGYLNAVKEEFPHSKLVIDRFHVAMSYRKASDSLRKSELKRLKDELPTQAYSALKGHLWAFRKNPNNINEEEKIILERLFSYSNQLKQAYDLRNELTSIFDEKISKQQALEKICTWMKKVEESQLKCFDTFLKTLENYKDEITNYFYERKNSGFIEGLNNKIKVIKRRCYGILNPTHLFQRICLDLQGYLLFT